MALPSLTPRGDILGSATVTLRFADGRTSTIEFTQGAKVDVEFDLDGPLTKYHKPGESVPRTCGIHIAGRVKEDATSAPRAAAAVGDDESVSPMKRRARAYINLASRFGWNADQLAAVPDYVLDHYADLS